MPKPKSNCGVDALGPQIKHTRISDHPDIDIRVLITETWQPGQQPSRSHGGQQRDSKKPRLALIELRNRARNIRERLVNLTSECAARVREFEAPRNAIEKR